MSPEERQPYKWIPPEGYYQEIAKSNVNDVVNFVGRMAVGLYGFVRFGRSKVVPSSGFDEARDEIAKGNVIAASIHRSGLDTVLLPSALERVGLHHSRPMSKLAIFQNRVLRWGMHKLGGYAVDKDGDNLDMEGLSVAQAGILRRAELSDKKRYGLLRRKVKNGYETIYAEGTRIDTDVLRVAKIKRGIAIAALENNSLIVPVAFQGLSSEKIGKKPDKVTVARDARSWFGFRKRLVFCVGTPFRLEPLSEEAAAEPFGRVWLEEINKRRSIVQQAMQDELDRAIEIRGSSLEKKYPQPEL